MSDAHDDRELRRRLEVLRRPVTVLTLHGLLLPAIGSHEWERQPSVVGVGPDHTAMAVWPSRTAPDRMLVTRHSGGRRIESATVVHTTLRPSFVQPLPDDRLLLVAARDRRIGDNAQVWSADGDLVTSGAFGDAIEHVLTTVGGSVWVGYFDEALGGRGPQAHGLARFTADLAVDWVYPQREPWPIIVDCYALNVVNEKAVACAYSDFHLLSAEDSRVTDLGVSPMRGARNVLVSGSDAVIVGGYGAEYDLVVPVQFDRDGVREIGTHHRLVLPDGLEVHAARYTCRGPELHAIIGNRWYRTTIDQLRTTSP